MGNALTAKISNAHTLVGCTHTRALHRHHRHQRRHQPVRTLMGTWLMPSDVCACVCVRLSAHTCMLCPGILWTCMCVLVCVLTAWFQKKANPHWVSYLFEHYRRTNISSKTCEQKMWQTMWILDFGENGENQKLECVSSISLRLTYTQRKPMHSKWRVGQRRLFGSQ